MIVPFNKILSTKIYYTENIYYNLSIEELSSKVVRLYYNNFSNLTDFFQYFKISLNKVNIYSNDTIITLPNFNKVNNKSYINSLKKNIITFNRNSRRIKLFYKELSKIEPTKNLSIIEYSEPFNRLLDYIQEHKVSGTKLQNLYNRFFESYQLDNKLKTISIFVIDLNNQSYIDFLIKELKLNLKNLNKINITNEIFLINLEHKIILKVDLNEKNVQKTLNLLNKFKRFINGFDKDSLKDSSIEIGNSNLLTSDEKEEIVKDKIATTDELEVDIEDIEDKIEVINNVTSEDETSVLGNSNLLTSDEKEEIVKDKIATTDELEVDIEDIVEVINNVTSEDETSVLGSYIEDIDIDEIIDSGSIENSFDTLTKENKEFLSKMENIQKKALESYEIEYAKKSKDKSLDAVIVPDNTIINQNMKNIKYSAITQSYYKKQYDQDLLNIVKSLNNDLDYPAIVSKFERTPSNDTLNLKEELHVEFIDKKHKRHSFRIDIPVLSDDGFLYINGNKKFITKQLTRLPVVKETPDRVQITTNYRKTFLFRKGTRSNTTVDKIIRVLTKKKYPNIEITRGNASKSNVNLDVHMLYNDLSNTFYSIKFKYDDTFSNKTNTVLLFNNPALVEFLKKSNIIYDANKIIPIGYTEINGKVESIIGHSRSNMDIYNITSKSSRIIDKSLIEYFNRLIISNPNNKELYDDYKLLGTRKSMAYTDIKIAGINIPLGILLSLYLGLREMLDRYNIKYTIENKRRNTVDNETRIIFNDAIVYIRTEMDPNKELIVNGLVHLDTESYTLVDSARLGAIYIDYLGKTTGSRNTIKALWNFESSMIDPITLEVLKELNLPTDFKDLTVYASSLLTNYKHSRKNNMSDYRVRDSEVIAVATYEALMKAFNEYKRTFKLGTNASISTPKDQIIKNISAYNNIEGFSLLNPFKELQDKSKTTFKGPSGLNSDQAFTIDIRTFDSSMLGICGMYSPDSASVGINRCLSLNPKLEGTRGRIISDRTVANLSSDQIFTGGVTLLL